MTTAEKVLMWFIRLSAIMFICAAPAIVMPTWLMRWFAELKGVDLPDAPLVEYLTRHLSALYVSMGASYWYMSCDIRRYLPLLRFSVPVMAGFDVVIILLDVWIPMPPMWIIGEATAIISWTIALWWLVRRAGQSVESNP